MFPSISQEFKKRFDELYITSLNPQNLEDLARQRLYTLAEVTQEVLLYPDKVRSGHQGTKKWEEVKYNGSWIRNSTAGGPPQGVSQGNEGRKREVYEEKKDGEGG